ncbi:hypothetical protein IEQ34_020118 [Dendrobium chrysotoxum]|uniref:DUF4283 domain-containing protein n=1 Tax=Dendrobium chrysotoxum TaxID=161865 RepID=A0AAV7FZN0_DENCH|nr:hypothetical protein IEQ34_020118 [Dendrobium chrysotoxum]
MGYIQLVEMEEFPSYYAHSKVLGHSRVECHILNPQLARILHVLWLMGWKWMWVIKLVKMRLLTMEKLYLFRRDHGAIVFSSAGGFVSPIIYPKMAEGKKLMGCEDVLALSQVEVEEDGEVEYQAEVSGVMVIGGEPVVLLGPESLFEVPITVMPLMKFVKLLRKHSLVVVSVVGGNLESSLVLFGCYGCFLFAQLLSGEFSVTLLNSKNILIKFLNNLTSLLIKWTPLLYINIESPTIPIWVSFLNLHPHLFSNRIFHGLGSLFGHPLRMDNSTPNGPRPSVSCACGIRCYQEVL